MSNERGAAMIEGVPGEVGRQTLRIIALVAVIFGMVVAAFTVLIMWVVQS